MMRPRPIRRATTRLVLVIGVICLIVGLLQASVGLLDWPSEAIRPSLDVLTALLLIGIGVTLVSFRRS